MHNISYNGDYYPALKAIPSLLRHSQIRNRLRVTYRLSGDIVLKIAETTEEQEQAFRVLHDAYVDRGVQKPQKHGLRILKHHLLPTTTVFVMKKRDEVIGTVSQIIDGPIGLPMDGGWDLEPLREHSVPMAEISSLAVKKEYRGRFDSVPLFFRLSLDHARRNRIRRWVISTEAQSRDYYQALFFFQAITDQVVDYSLVNGEPSIAQTLDLSTLEMKMKAVYGQNCLSKNLHNYCFDADFGEIFQIPENLSTETSSMSAEAITYFHSKTGILNEITSHNRMDLLLKASQKEYGSILGALDLVRAASSL